MWVNVCVVRGPLHVRAAVGGIDPLSVQLPEVEAAILAGDAADMVHALHRNLMRGRHVRSSMTMVQTNTNSGYMPGVHLIMTGAAAQSHWSPLVATIDIIENITSHRCGAMPLETRVTHANFDPADENPQVRSSTQIPHQMPRCMAQVFGLPETRIQVLADDVGGGFGA